MSLVFLLPVTSCLRRRRPVYVICVGKIRSKPSPHNIAYPYYHSFKPLLDAENVLSRKEKFRL